MQLLYNLRIAKRYIKRFGIRSLPIFFNRERTKKRMIRFEYKDYKNPVYLRGDSSDILVFEQVLLYQEYNVKYADTPLTIFDCGANIGLAAIYFKNRFPNAKIVCIEPEKENFEMLLRNTIGYSDIHCYNNAIWNKTTNLVIEPHPLGNWAFMVKETNGKEDHSIKATTIEVLMKELEIEQIDVLKIDIEGSEKELFELNYDYWLSKTKMIIIELHDWMNEGASRSFFKALVKYNFTMSHFGENIICYLK
jgi:FkbM family methyltransferase